MIDTALSFLTRAEWYAIIGAVLMGTFLTELLKRTARRLLSWDSPPGLYPWLGFMVTSTAAYSVWPSDGLFPHPLFMSILLGAVAPALYKLTTVALRRFGFAWIADAITGERRKQGNGRRRGVERRRG